MKKTLFCFALFLGCFYPFSAVSQVQVAPFLTSNPQFLDDTGAPCAGCLLSTFAAGTTTPQATYSDSAGTVLNANPVVLDSAGHPTSGAIFLTSASYKFVLKSALGVTLWSADNVTWANLAQTFTSITSNGQVQLIPSTAATLGANQSSPNFQVCGNFWNGSASAADCWNIQDILGTGTNPTSTFNVTHSGSSGTTTVNFAPPLSFSNSTFTNATLSGTTTVSGTMTNSANITATAGSNTINAGKFNNRIYIDGVKYPITQSGIQQALTDACSVNLGNGPGTVVYLPPMNVTLTATTGAQFTLTCAVDFSGAGAMLTRFSIGASVPNTVPFLLYQPTFTTSASRVKFHSFIVVGGGHGGTGIRFDSTNSGIEGFSVYDTEIITLDPASPCIDFTGALNVGWGRIDNNHLGCGVKMNTTTSADSIEITHNVFDGSSTATGPCVDATTINGSAQIVVQDNNAGCLGGFVISHGTQQLKIIHNQWELTEGATTETNSALIDLIGDTYSIGEVEIIGNNLNTHSNATRDIRIGNATNVRLESNVIFETPTTGIGIDITNSASGTVVGENVFSGGGAQDINDSGLRTQYRNNKGATGSGGLLPGGLFQAPADGQQALIARGNSGTQAADLFLAQSSAGSSLFGVNKNGNFFTKEGTAPAGLTGLDICYGDSTAHAIECSYNNGTFGVVPMLNRTQSWTGDQTLKRVLYGGGTPSCAVTGAGSSPTCTVSGSDSGGIMTITAGTTPGSSGTITITYTSGFSSTSSFCTMMLSAGSATWNARATVIGGGPATTSFQANWDNNAVNLTAASSYNVNYMCAGR